MDDDQLLDPRVRSVGVDDRESPRKIDALVVAMPARIARADVLAAGAHDSEHTGEVWAL